MPHSRQYVLDTSQTPEQWVPAESGPKGASASNGISTSNSRAAATLAAGATFQGVGEDVSAYGRVGVAIHSTNSTDGTFTMEVSHDKPIYGGPSWQH